MKCNVHNLFIDFWLEEEQSTFLPRGQEKPILSDRIMSFGAGPEDANSIFPGNQPPLKSAWHNEKDIVVPKNSLRPFSLGSSVCSALKRCIKHDF